MHRLALVFICALSLAVKAAEVPTAMDLIDAYALTQDKVKSFVIKSEDKSVNRSSQGRGVQETSYRKSEVRYDGERVSLRNQIWGGFAMGTPIIPREKAEYQSFLWDGDRYYQHNRSKRSRNRPHGYVKIHNHGRYATDLIAGGYSGGPLLGYFCGDTRRIDVILREADTIHVEPKPILVNGSRCYELAAIAASGSYTVCLDPEHGYNISRLRIERKGGDIVRDRTMSDIERISCTVDNVRFKKFGETWLPIEADLGLFAKLPSGQWHQSKSHHKRTEVSPNPSFDGLFVPDDIEDGALVRLNDMPGVTYTWRKGELIPRKNGEVKNEN